MCILFFALLAYVGLGVVVSNMDHYGQTTTDNMSDLDEVVRRAS